MTDGELIAVRARYLASATGQPSEAIAHDMAAWRAAIERHDSYDELVLWFEHDLFDQLNLVQLLAWLPARRPAPQTVSLVCIGSLPGRPDFKGLGELEPRELAPLLETRQRVTDRQYALAAEAWRAFREPTPDAVDDLRQRDTSALPFLAAALTRFLEEYPWTTDGLSKSERRFLQIAAAGPLQLRAAFPRMHDGETAFYITDLSYAGLVTALSLPPAELISLGDSLPAVRALPHGTATLTELGRAVLNRQRDKVEACGIDRWYGGVHVQADGSLWRWDAERQRIRGRPRV